MRRCEECGSELCPSCGECHTCGSTTGQLDVEEEEDDDEDDDDGDSEDAFERARR